MVRSDRRAKTPSLPSISARFYAKLPENSVTKM